MYETELTCTTRESICCSVLHCDVVCCSALQCNAVSCNVLQPIVVGATRENRERGEKKTEYDRERPSEGACARTRATEQEDERVFVLWRLRGSATHCNTRQHTATHCNTLQHTATHCNTLQRTATQLIHLFRMAAAEEGRRLLVHAYTHTHT